MATSARFKTTKLFMNGVELGNVTNFGLTRKPGNIDTIDLTFQVESVTIAKVSETEDCVEIKTGLSIEGGEFRTAAPKAE